MEFHVNHPVLFILTGILVAVVLGQSVYFLLKALKRSREIGMDQTKIKKTIKTAAIFTIAPAVSVSAASSSSDSSVSVPISMTRSACSTSPPALMIS